MPLLQLKNISKNFGVVKVLKHIDLQIVEGEILGVVGENGAGKSTLMNILGGVQQPSSGKMFYHSRDFSPSSPNDALTAGIAFIHQELNLFPNLSVLDNLFLKDFPRKTIAGVSLLDKTAAKNQVKLLLEKVGLQLLPHKLVEDCTPAQRQLLEIAKALSSSPNIIIFDEPTTSLTGYEAEKLFLLMQTLKKQRIAMIYISHHLEDVTNIADRIAVLRDGELINVYHRSAGYDLNNIITDMVGREMQQRFPKKKGIPECNAILKVENLNVDGAINNVSFTIRRKEILGFYGLVGAGRTEVARTIYGLDDFGSGNLYWKDQPRFAMNPTKWIMEKVAFLTEDRREEGLLLPHNIQKNIALAAWHHFRSPFLGFVRRKNVASETESMALETKIKYNSLTDQMVQTLSGGNQQKVVLSKWLLTEPELLIMDEPTKGIDIGAKFELYKIMNQLVFEGASIMLISSDLEELLGLCDRILVMSKGIICAEFSKSEFNRNAILEAALSQPKNQAV